MNETVAGETRGERKERTRRAILDATLELCEDSSLVALSLRQVAKEVGIVPTAFYRHFPSIDELGLSLVDESFASLRTMLREIRTGNPAPAQIIERSVTVLAEHVAAQRHHFAFIARERASGPPRVREAVRHQLQLFEHELATDLARLAPRWSTEDLQTVSHLIVGATVTTVEDLLAAGNRPEAQRMVTDRAIKELRMVVVGVLQWRSDYRD